MGEKDFVRLSRNNTGAQPSLLGKEAAVVAKRGFLHRERGEMDQAIEMMPGGRAGLAAGPGKGDKGKAEDEGKAGPRDAPPFSSPRRRGWRGSPPPGLRLPARAQRGVGGGKVCWEVAARGKAGVSEGARLGNCGMFLLWQELSMQQVPGALPV